MIYGSPNTTCTQSGLPGGQLLWLFGTFERTEVKSWQYSFFSFSASCRTCTYLRPATSQGKGGKHCAWPFCLQEWVEWESLKVVKSAAYLPLISLLEADFHWAGRGFPHSEGRGDDGSQRCGFVCAGSTLTHFFFPQVMVPSLDDIQQAINRMIQLTLEVSRGVAHWGQQSRAPSRGSLAVPPARLWTCPIQAQESNWRRKTVRILNLRSVESQNYNSKKVFLIFLDIRTYLFKVSFICLLVKFCI